MKPDPIPNGKTDTNNNGAFSTDYIGGNYDYADGDYATRARIWQAHVDYVQGFLYFLQHDPQVPSALHAAMAPWGLCKDEFVDTGHWPHQLYVREARRMVGEFVVSQKDIQTELTKPDAIGMGSYNSDSHNIQRIVNAEGFAENEGDMQVSVTPYQIPYRVMLPRRSEATNLLVPVAFSASHVAYSTLRMEPQYMIIGHAAGRGREDGDRCRHPGPGRAAGGAESQAVEPARRLRVGEAEIGYACYACSLRPTACSTARLPVAPRCPSAAFRRPVAHSCISAFQHCRARLLASGRGLSYARLQCHSTQRSPVTMRVGFTGGGNITDTHIRAVQGVPGSAARRRVWPERDEGGRPRRA